MRKFFDTWIADPHKMVVFHFWAAVAWMLPGTLLAAWLVFGIPDMKWAAFGILMVSNYANFVSHWSAWQAVRAELADVDAKV